MTSPPERTSHSAVALGERVCFLVRGLACPALLSRLLGLLAQQDRLPETVAMRRSLDGIIVRITLDGIEAPRSAIIAEKMRSMITVRSVRVRVAGDRSEVGGLGYGPYREASAGARR